MYFWRRVLNTYFSGVAEDYFLVWYDATCFHFLFSWTIVTLQYVLVSAIHQHESVIGIYMSPPSWTFLPSPSPSYHPSRFSQSTRFGFLAFYHLNTLDLLWLFFPRHLGSDNQETWFHLSFMWAWSTPASFKQGSFRARRNCSVSLDLYTCFLSPVILEESLSY